MPATAQTTVSVDLDGSIYRHVDHTLSERLEVEVFEYVDADGLADQPTYQLRIHDEPPLTRGELVQVVTHLVELLAAAPS